MQAAQQSQLIDEFERLRKLFDCYDLRLRWLPNNSMDKAGEIRDSVIYIYATEIKDALSTLRHEFLDYLVSSAVKPYSEVVNAQRLIISGLIGLLEQRGYEEKEKTVLKLENVLKALDALATSH